MTNPNNRFLSEKDRKKAENDTGNIYSQEIDKIMRGKMAAEWQPTSDNDIKRLPSLPSNKTISSESKNYVSNLKKKDEEKRFSEQKKEEKAATKKSKNPYVRMGKETEADFQTRMKKKKEDFKSTREKYPIVDQASWLFENTVKPVTEGMLKAAGDTVGEVVTNKYVDKAARTLIPDGIENKDVPSAAEGKKNLRNYLTEREEAQKGFGKVAYKGGEIGTNLALMSAVSSKLPFIGKLDTLTKSKYLNRALREGAENVILEGGLDLAKGDTENFLTDRLKDFGGGAIFGAGMEAGSRVLGKVGKANNIPYIPKEVESKAAEEVIEPITDFTPTKQLDLLEKGAVTEQLNFKEQAGVKSTQKQVVSTVKPKQQTEGQTSLFDNQTKMSDNEQLNILDEPKENSIPTPITKTIPKVPTKYDIQNPKGKLQPHVVGGKYTPSEADPIKRDFVTLGNKKVKAIGYQHPELRPYIESEAYALKGELERTVKASSGQIKDENGTIIKGERKARITSPDIGNLKDITKASYKDLSKAIDDVIEDNGKENYALAKRVEKVIDERLTKGYDDDIYGETIPPHEGYMSQRNEIYGEGENYSKIPKLAERENIIKRFNEEYGNFPSQRPPQQVKPQSNINTPPQVKTSPQPNSEVLDDTVLNKYSLPKNEYDYEDVYKNLNDRVNPDYEPSEEELENTFTNIYPKTETVDKTVDNVKNIQNKVVDEDELLEKQLEMEKVVNAGKKVKLQKFGECEIVEEANGVVRLKNSKGNEFSVGEAAFENLKIEEPKATQPKNTPSPIPSVKKTETKIELKSEPKIEQPKKSEIETLEEEHKKFVENINKMPTSNIEMKNKKLKAEAMQYSTKKRELIQGDSLEPVEGGLTPKELQNKVNQLNKNSVGKNIIVDGKEGTIKSNSYGKVKVEFKDGTSKTYSNDEIPKQLPLDYQNKQKSTAKSETAYTSDGDTAVSKMRTNTYKNADFLQEEPAKKVVDKISGEYEILHDKDLLNSAKIKLEEDFDNEVSKLIKKADGLSEGLMDAEDITKASMITKKMIEESKSSGDTEQLKSWLKKIRIQATSLGQAVHSISLWKKQTPEGMLLKTQKTIDDVVKNMKNENPKKFKAAEQMAEETKVIVNDILDKIKKTEPKKTIEEILETPSPKTKKIIEEATKNSDTKIKEAIKDAVDNKELKNITKIAEKVLEKNGIPSLTDSDIKFITEKMENIQKLTTSREKDIEYALVKKLIAEKIPPTMKDKLLAAQRINLLLNPRTNIKNIAGNVVMGGLENVKDIVATPIDKVVSKYTGQRTTTIPSISEQLKGFVKGAKEGLEDAKLGIDTSKMSGRYSDLETNRMYDLPKAQAFRHIDNPKTVVEHLNNLASKSEKATHTLLSMGDRPFFEAAFSGSISQQLKLNGGEVTEEMVERAIKDAEERTFQNVNELTRGMQLLKTGLNKVGKRVTGTEFNIGDVALPFIKTPANILDKAIDYSPIGGVQGFAKIVNGIKTGKLDQKAAVDQLARGLTGTSLIFAGYELSKNGVLFGKGAKDTDARALEQQAGRLPYSIKNGSKYTTIDWIQPAAIPLMIGADIYEQKKNDKEAKNVILNAIKSGGKTLFDQSLLMGMSDLFGGYSTSGGENLMEGLKKTALNGATQFVPYNSALSQITKITDTNVRNTYDENDLQYNLVNKTKAKIPFLSEDLPKKYSTVGKEVKQNYGAKGLENAFHSLINPAKTGTFNPSPAEKLALDIYDRTGETIQIPRVADKEIKYKIDDGSKNGKSETYKLNGKDLSEFQRIMGEKTEEAFQEISKTSKFETMSDEEKAAALQKLMTKIKSESKYELLSKKKINYKN